MLISRLLNLVRAPRIVREWSDTETAMLKIATIIGCPGSGEAYERLVMACHRVASYYLYPMSGTLEELYNDLAGGQSTDLVEVFNREYGKEQVNE